jgi:dTDP-4-amino-4,6-dideoxygalactose transaminase
LVDQPVILPPHADGEDIHSWHLYVIRLDDSVRIGRDEFIRRMADRGIGCSVHFIPLHLHPYWRDAYDLQPHHFPLSWLAYERAVSLPLYTRMTESDQSRVIEAVKDALAAPSEEEFPLVGNSIMA